MKKNVFIVVVLLGSALHSFAQLDSIPVNNSLKVTNPGAYPYGVDIDVNYTGGWDREFGLSYNNTGKVFSFGVYGTSGTMNYGYIGGNTSNPLSNSSPWMVFLPSGNVGINTTTPNAQLEVKSCVDMNNSGTQYVGPLHIGLTNDYGVSQPQQYILLIPAYNGTVGQNSSGMSGRLTIVRGSGSYSNTMQDYDISAQTAYNVSNINVVPRSNQTYPLNIYTVTYNGVPYLALLASEAIWSGGEVNYEGYFWNNVNGVIPQLVLASACTNISEFQSYTYLAGSVLTVNADGYVGVGTSNPQSLFSVEGTITAQQLNITLQNWSDFVFDSTYQPLPLAQVATYVHSNKHLPDIPSAADIARDGLDVGAMQKLHMQKIEELTLYAIEADQKIRRLDSTNNLQQQTLIRQQYLLEQLQAQLQKQQLELDRINTSVSSH
jgi:hypothetical protein